MRGGLPQRSDFPGVIEFIVEQLQLLPFLFVTYLILEGIEAHAGGALGRFLERARSIGPLVGSAAGAFPQCGFSAAAASLYSGGIITVGTLIAVFLSTSDELIPVMLSQKAPTELVAKIVGLKVVFAMVVGFAINGILVFFRGKDVPLPHIDELCEHSHCGCHKHKGIVVPALIHTAEIFVFVFIVASAVELAIHYLGVDAFQKMALNRPVLGECLGAALGLIPNCAVSAAAGDLYLSHPDVISSGALMASSFSGCGVGLLVLFRTNRNLKLNLLILLSVYVLGAFLGGLAGTLI